MSVLDASKAIADELNPLTISHTARTISFTPIGRFKKIEVVEKGLIRSNTPNKLASADIHNNFINFIASLNGLKSEIIASFTVPSNKY